MYLVEGISLHFHEAGEAVSKKIKEESGQSEQTLAGLRITLEQTNEMRIPAEMLAPLLGALAEVPALVALDMMNLCAGF